MYLTTTAGIKRDAVEVMSRCRLGVGDGKKRDFKIMSKFKPEDWIKTGDPNVGCNVGRKEMSE